MPVGEKQPKPLLQSCGPLQVFPCVPTLTWPGAPASSFAPMPAAPAAPLAPPALLDPPAAGGSLMPVSTQNGGEYLPSAAASLATPTIQSFQDATEPYTGLEQSGPPRETTPTTLPAGSSAGPPESPEQIPVSPMNSSASMPVPQAPPGAQETLRPARAMRTPAIPASPGVVSP